MYPDDIPVHPLPSADDAAASSISIFDFGSLPSFAEPPWWSNGGADDDHEADGSDFAQRFSELVGGLTELVEQWDHACSLSPALAQTTLDQLPEHVKRFVQSFQSQCSMPLSHQGQPMAVDESCTLDDQTAVAHRPSLNVDLDLDYKLTTSSLPQDVDELLSWLSDLHASAPTSEVVPSSCNASAPSTPNRSDSLPASLLFTPASSSTTTPSSSIDTPMEEIAALFQLSTPVAGLSAPLIVPGTNVETVFVLLDTNPRFTSSCRDNGGVVHPLRLVSVVPPPENDLDGRHLLVFARKDRDELEVESDVDELLTVIEESPTMIPLAEDGSQVDVKTSRLIVFGFPVGSIVMSQDQEPAASRPSSSSSEPESDKVQHENGREGNEELGDGADSSTMVVGQTRWWRRQICRGKHAKSPLPFWQGSEPHVRRGRILRHFATCKQGVVASELTAFAIACLKAASPDKRVSERKKKPTLGRPRGA